VALTALLAVVYATPGDTVWIVDCGNKALQARRLLETGFGSLSFEHPARHLDPEGLAFPIPEPFAVARGEGYVSHYPPAYAALAAPFLAALGPPGLRVPAALGAAACAMLFALWVGPALGRGWAAAGGLWLVLATPLVFYGVTIWEHILSVALALGAWLAIRRPAPGRLLAAGLLVGLACWLREELVLMGPGVALAGWCERRRLMDAGWIALGALPPLAALALFNLVFYGHSLGVHVSLNVGARPMPGPGIALRDLGAVLAGYGEGPLEGVLFAGVLLGAWLGGAWVAHRGRAPGAALLLITVAALAAWLAGAWRIAGADHVLYTLTRYNGMLLQAPVVSLAGMGAVWVWRRRGLAPLRGGVTAGLVFLGLGLVFRVTMTSFSSGGHWGPRMLLPALPALLGLSLAALREGARVADPRRPALAGAATAALVVAGLASSAVAIRLLDQQKREAGQLQLLALAAPSEVVVTDHPALGQQLPAIWGKKPLLLVRDRAGLRRVAARIDAAGAGPFLYLHRPAAGVRPSGVRGPRCRLLGRHRGREVRHVFDLDVYECGGS
jgi:hypothetical protein